MSPRTYRQVARAGHADATRRRIVDAAVRLHAQRGALATSWDEIAHAAGVNRATVYRHFPTLDALVPACARVAFEAIDLPDEAVLEAGFAGLDTRARLRRVVFESCACFERGAEWLWAARREGDLVPAFAEVNRRLSAGAAALVAAACAQDHLGEDRLALLGVLIDFPFWQQLVNSGVPTGRAPELICSLCDAVVAGQEGAG